MEISLAVPKKTGQFQRTLLYHSWAYTQRIPQHSIRTYAPLCYSSLIYNSQKLERTQISLNGGMDTENVVLYIMEYYSAIKNNEFMNILGKWLELENIILREVNQSQKNTHGMQSLTSGY